MQYDISAQVSAAIEPKLVLAELDRARNKPTASLQAFDLSLRAWQQAQRSAPLAEFEQARSLLQRAIEIDPGYAYAKSMLARAHMMANQNGWMSNEQAEASPPLRRAGPP